MCLVGEEQCGWQRVIEVADDRGWKRFWVRDKNFFREKAQALESGHSEVLTAYLGAMAKFHTYSFLCY